LSKQATVLWLAALFFSAASILLTYAMYTQTYYPALRMDEWGALGFYFDKGFWPSVLCQHNSHVVILPNAVMRLVSLMTDADPFIRGMTTLLSASVLGVLVGYVSSRALETGYMGSRLVRLSRFTVALAFILWLVCYRQLFWGMAIYSYFALLFGFAAVVALDAILHRKEKPGALLLLPALLATASTISFSYGVASWGALAVLLFLHKKPWKWIAATPILGLGLFMGLRLSLPHCRPLSILTPDVSIAHPLVMAQSLVSLIGNVWIHSLAPLLAPSSLHAGIMGTLGVGLLCWLTIYAWKARGFRTYKLLVTGCWLAAGMLLLVAVGRNPANFVFADQMIADRFMPLSILFWACLLAASGCRPGASSLRANCAAIHAVAGCYLLVTALLSVSWMSSMRAGDMHFTSAEIKVEAIRAWVSPESSGEGRTTDTLGLLDGGVFRDHVGELRTRKWDFYRAFPSTVFPTRVAAIESATIASHPAAPALTIKKSRKASGGTWTLKGSLRGDLPSGVKHMFIAHGDEIIGYGVPALYPAFENTRRQPWAGWGELPARMAAAVNRLAQLLGEERYWNGISKSNPGPGEWQCEWWSDATLLCRATAKQTRASYRVISRSRPNL